MPRVTRLLVPLIACLTLVVGCEDDACTKAAPKLELTLTIDSRIDVTRVATIEITIPGIDFGAAGPPTIPVREPSLLADFETSLTLDVAGGAGVPSQLRGPDGTITLPLVVKLLTKGGAVLGQGLTTSALSLNACNFLRVQIDPVAPGGDGAVGGDAAVPGDARRVDGGSG